MDDDEKLTELLDLARSLGIEVRLTPAAGLSCEHSAGALVVLKGREILLMDPTAPIAERVALTTDALIGRTQIENCFVRPAIRCLLDRPAAPHAALGACQRPHAIPTYSKTEADAKLS